ncbi:hypothetical protein D9615_009698 [Tricholomella constricta]|uniref:Cytochrome P450 n=1 Tax=Tricholomella constricta TaxID=117010 RepID=A0A8H5GUP6_9AGAR|nr:hypothetical protein D9615_009698 [Tricholomella constricta]
MSLRSLSKLDLVAAAFGLIVLHRYLTRKSKSSLPPGPPGLPIIGNVADMPTKKEWVTFAEWGKKWGGICSVNLLGRTMIIINSSEVMSELDKKGAIYSDRPRLEMGGELVGYSDTIVLLPYGQRFRAFRKYFANHLGPVPMENHIPTIQHETHRFLKRQLSKPGDLMQNLRKLAGGIILQLTYGITVEEGEDFFVNLIEGANRNFNEATVPGAFPVDFFPSLRHLPEWLPGMGFMETARTWAKATAAMVEVPFAFTKRQIASGTAPPSFVANLLEDEHTLSADEIRNIKFVASSMYAGADTTVSAEYGFFLAMTLHPGVLEKAQQEIDTVIGNDRLPTLADRPQLPYINALVTEVLRWNSVAPTGVPHASMEDGIIGGYLIPKGSIIVANLWNMLHDPETYPDPFVFNPDRHIASNGKPAQQDPRTMCFGYGRRICAGMSLAEASLFAAISMCLAVFDIKKAVENGIEVTPVHENTSGIISYPENFKCTINPRSEKAVALISQEYQL